MDGHPAVFEGLANRRIETAIDASDRLVAFVDGMSMSWSARSILCCSIAALSRSGRARAANLTPGARLLDPREMANLNCEEIDQQPDPRDARALRNDEHVERDGRQRIVGQDRLEPAGCQEIVDKPSMRRCAMPRPPARGLARGKSMVHPETPRQMARHGAHRPAPARRGCRSPSHSTSGCPHGQTDPTGKPAALARPDNPAPPQADAGCGRALPGSFMEAVR